MPTEAEAVKPPMDIATRRILRMAVGTALGMWMSQAIAWPMSFAAPLLAYVFLSLPLPRPTLKMAIGFVAALALSSYAGVVLLPFLQYARWVGIGLIVLNANDNLPGRYRPARKQSTRHNGPGRLLHQPVITGQIRLALTPVDHEGIDHPGIIGGNLDMGRESGSA